MSNALLTQLYSFDKEGKIKKKKKRRRLLKNLKKSRLEKLDNTQMKFLELEAKYFEESRKREIILDSLYLGNSEGYLAFTVCRNPVERLLSVYQYLDDMFQRKNILFMSSSRYGFIQLNYSQFLVQISYKMALFSSFSSG